MAWTMPFFSKGCRQVGEEDGLNVEESHHLPPTTAVPYTHPAPAELSSLTSLKAWGEKQRIHHNISFLLVLAEEEATGNRKCGLLTIWVNPCQARVHFMEEAVRNLTMPGSPVDLNWPYALVQLHEDTCHAPLPKEGHLGILSQRGAETTACRRISQLEFCKLLISQLAGCLPNRVEWM